MIARLHGFGWSERAIAEKLVLHRTTVQYHSCRLGLPAQGTTKFVRRRISAGVKRRYKKEDIRGVGYVRHVDDRIAAVRSGWPAGVTAGEASVLAALWKGWLTLAELAGARPSLLRQQLPYSAGSRSGWRSTPAHCEWVEEGRRQAGSRLPAVSKTLGRGGRFGREAGRTAAGSAKSIFPPTEHVCPGGEAALRVSSGLRHRRHICRPNLR